MSTEQNPITPEQAGISIAVLSGPRGGVDTSKHENKESKWPHIEYTVELSFKKRPFFTGPFKLGIGHVKLPDAVSFSTSCKFTTDEGGLLSAWIRKPHSDFVNKQLQADTAAKLAVIQKVAPKLDDVMASLLMDGSPHFDSETLEDWCANFGFDTDSRKAEETYRECEDTGKKLMRALGRELINQLRQWASNY